MEIYINGIYINLYKWKTYMNEKKIKKEKRC